MIEWRGAYNYLCTAEGRGDVTRLSFHWICKYGQRSKPDSLPRSEGDLATPQRCTSQPQLLPPDVLIPAFNVIKFLQQANSNVRGFRESELL